MDLQGRTVLVAGGGSGLGAACVQRLVERGARVLIADLDDRAAEFAGSFGDRAAFAKADVTDEAQVRAAIDAAESRFGDLRGAVICAGILKAGRVVGKHGPADLETFRQVVEVNLIGTFNVLRLAAASIARHEPIEGNADAERGVIVMTSSVAAFEGQMGQTAYAASKGGVASLTLPAARDLARFGLRVASVAPGVFETPMMANVSENVRQSLAESIPFPSRLGRPEEFARLVEQIFENPMLNGCVLRLDGALRMGPR